MALSVVSELTVSDLCRDRLCSSFQPPLPQDVLSPFLSDPWALWLLSFPFSATGWTDAPPLLFYLKPHLPMPSPTVAINVLCWLSFMQGATSKLTWETELKDRTLQKSSFVLSVHYRWSLVPEKYLATYVYFRAWKILNIIQIFCGVSTQPGREGV